MLEDIVGETNIHPRVFYLAADVTVPAGGSITIAADMVKAPSFDYICSGSGNEGLTGYDMVTRLGTNIEFDSLSASLMNAGAIEIVRQNYGFDIDAGVSTVELDTAVDHYYLEIRQRKD